MKNKKKKQIGTYGEVTTAVILALEAEIKDIEARIAKLEALEECPWPPSGVRAPMAPPVRKPISFTPKEAFPFDHVICDSGGSNPADLYQ